MKSINDKINEELNKIQDLTPLPIIENDTKDKLSSYDDIKFSQDSWDNMNTQMGFLDDYVIKPLDLSNISTVLSTNNPGFSSIYTSTSTPSTILPLPNYNWNSNYNWTTTTQPNHIMITSDGINMPENADITIGQRSLLKILDNIEQRLSILVPDPKKLKKYEALQQAYDHFKTLEALCSDDTNLDKK